MSSEEESEVDNLDEVSVDSMLVTGKELQEVLTKLADSHRATGDHLATLAPMASEMMADQIETTASTVSAELLGCPGLQAMFDRYDPSKIPLILAIGCKNYEETEKVKGRWANLISYDRLVKVFGMGKQQIQDGCTRTSYRSMWSGVRTTCSGTKRTAHQTREAVSIEVSRGENNTRGAKMERPMKSGDHQGSTSGDH